MISKPERFMAWSCLAVGGLAILLLPLPSLRAVAGVDYYDYHFAGRAVLAGLSPYDAAWARAQAMQASVPVIANSDFIYPPWFAAAMVPFALLPLQLGFATWYAFSAVAMQWIAGQLGGRRRPIWWLMITFVPAWFTLVVGQVNLLLVALLTLAWLRREARPSLAGVALGVAAAIKFAPGLLIVVALLQGRRRLALTAAGTIALLLVAGECAAPGSTKVYFGQILPGVGALPVRYAHPVNQGLGGAILRLCTPNPWTIPAVTWSTAQCARLVTAGIALAATWVLLIVARHRRPDPRTEARTWALAIAVALVSAPVAWESTYVWLLLPLGLTLGLPGATRPAAILTGAIVAQRLLDPFAHTPTSFPLLVHHPLLTSLSLLGALVWIAATSWRLVRLEPSVSGEPVDGL